MTLDDLLILRFLRVCKFNLEKAKTRIRNCHKLRIDFPEWFTNKDPLEPALQELFDIGHKISDLFKIILMLIELTMKTKNYSVSSVYGCALYIDAIDLTIYHILQFGPTVFKNTVHIWENYPMRMQLINVINAPIIFDVCAKIIKSFMSEKLKSRFNVYSHMLPSCFKDVPANILPIEYGGTDGTTQELIDYWKKLVEENRDWFIASDVNDKID